MSFAIQLNMYTDHVDVSQAFVQGDLLPGDGHNGKVSISALPGYAEEFTLRVSPSESSRFTECRPLPEHST